MAIGYYFKYFQYSTLCSVQLQYHYTIEAGLFRNIARNKHATEKYDMCTI